MDAGSQEGGRTLVTVEIEEAQARLSELVDRAVQGEAFVIAKAGKKFVAVRVADGTSDRASARAKPNTTTVPSAPATTPGR